mgnify:CR=1 FL=1
MKILTLGPKGSFSEIASKNFLRNFNEEGQISFCSSISEVFENVFKNLEKELFGVIPVENMIDGSVGESLDLLYKYSSIEVISEVIIPINLCLASKSSLKDVSKVISHPKAIGQCREYVLKKGFRTESELSTSSAMKRVSENNSNEGLAAIGTREAAEYYGLNVLDENIEDNKNNVTRFFVISSNKNLFQEKNKKQDDKKSYKTSLAIHPTSDEPGLLLKILEPFSKKGVNLTKIESRPTKVNLGEYIFYIDFDRDIGDREVKEALNEVKKFGEVRIFGSYFKGR